MPDPIEVRKVPIESVTDASGLSRLIADGVIEADRVLAVVGKTEGNGGVNDYTRILADRAFREVLAEHGHPAPESVPLVWSGGTDGILSPHATIFATTADAPATDEPRLSVGVAMSEVILPEDIGYLPWWRRSPRGQGGHEDRRHRRPARRALRTDQDAPAHPRHHHRRQEPRPGHRHRGDRPLHGPVQLHHRARHRRRARRDRDAGRRPDPQGSVALLLRRLVLVGRGAGPGADRAGGERARDRRTLPHRAQRDEGRPRRRRHLGGHQRRGARAARPPAPVGPRRAAGQRVHEVRGRPVGAGARTAQHHAGRLRRALAPADQGGGGRRGGLGHGRPGGVRLGGRRAPGPSGGGPVAAIADLGER